MLPARLLIALLLGFAVLPAHAGLFDDDEARAKATEASKRVDMVSKNQLEFSNQLEALRAELAALRGKYEVLANEMEATQKRQKDFYIDLDTRLRKLEPAVVEAGGEKAESKPAASTTEAADYEAALGLMKSGKYKEALGAFLSFIKANPNSSLLASAHFWVGSSYNQMREYGKAVQSFALVAKNWPNDPKAPEALLAQGSAQYDAGDAKSGKKTLERLIDKYPKSNAAQAARQRLKKK